MTGFPFFFFNCYYFLQEKLHRGVSQSPRKYPEAPLAYLSWAEDVKCT